MRVILDLPDGAQALCMTLVREDENGNMLVQQAMFDVSSAVGNGATILTFPAEHVEGKGGDADEQV